MTTEHVTQTQEESKALIENTDAVTTEKTAKKSIVDSSPNPNQNPNPNNDELKDVEMVESVSVSGSGNESEEVPFIDDKTAESMAKSMSPSQPRSNRTTPRRRISTGTGNNGVMDGSDNVSSMLGSSSESPMSSLNGSASQHKWSDSDAVAAPVSVSVSVPTYGGLSGVVARIRHSYIVNLCLQMLGFCVFLVTFLLSLTVIVPMLLVIGFMTTCVFSFAFVVVLIKHYCPPLFVVLRFVLGIPHTK